MNNNFVIILLVIIVLLFFSNVYEKFNSNNINLFYKNMPNIFMQNNYIDEQDITPTSNTDIKSLGNITLDSYVYSDIVSKKIICDNYTSQADCWENNNCQWIYKIDNGSYCDLAPKWLL